MQVPAAFLLLNIPHAISIGLWAQGIYDLAYPRKLQVELIVDERREKPKYDKAVRPFRKLMFTSAHHVSCRHRRLACPLVVKPRSPPTRSWRTASCAPSRQRPTDSRTCPSLLAAWWRSMLRPPLPRLLQYLSSMLSALPTLRFALPTM